MTDWFPAVIGLIGVVVGIAAVEIRIWRGQKDKYKDMVFEKRLDAHQEVFCRLHALQQFLLPHRLMKEGGVKALAKEISECNKSVARNALYLAKDSRIEIVMFLRYARNRGKKYTDAEWVRRVNVKKETAELVHNTAVVLGSVERGIGAKYLPGRKIRLEDSLLQEVLDETVEEEEILTSEQKE